MNEPLRSYSLGRLSWRPLSFVPNCHNVLSFYLLILIANRGNRGLCIQDGAGPQCRKKIIDLPFQPARLTPFEYLDLHFEPPVHLTIAELLAEGAKKGWTKHRKN